MKYFTLLSALCFAIAASAQNIVPNPNFSLYSSCPDDYSELSYCNGWHTATGSTPDYYNACNNATLSHPFGVPANVFGEQPANGGAYAGFYAFNGTTAEYREYIGTTIPPLEPGALYRVCIRVSLAGSSTFASDGLGTFFYINAVPDDTLHSVVSFLPQVEYGSYGPVTDSTNWVMLIGSFTADSAYTKLAIGNFNADSATHIDTVSSNAGGYAYYYIDSVAVERIHNASVASANTTLRANLYPNPSTDHAILTFSNPNHQNHTLSICDVRGIVVYKIENCFDGQIIIDSKDLAKGLYFYKLACDGDQVYGKMIVN